MRVKNQGHHTLRILLTAHSHSDMHDSDSNAGSHLIFVCYFRPCLKACRFEIQV